MRKVIFLLGLIFGIAMVSAIPQTVLSEINLTIANGSYHLRGEGLNAKDDFGIKLVNESNTTTCSFHYERYNIPITFTRDFSENDTDIATLTHALAKSLNYSDKWEQCVNNFTAYKEYGGYKTNYTNCKSDLSNANVNIANYKDEISEKNEEIDSLKTWRMILVIGVGICGFLAWDYRNKLKLRTAKNPMARFPQTSRH
jgi:hypothetical protein